MRIRVNIGRAVAAVLSATPARSDKARIVRGLGAAAMQYWKKIAQDGLRSTSRDYVQGLQYRSDDDRAFITLEGRMPNMVENGWAGGDLRQWLLSGPNVKQGKNGPYSTVPFRHGSPGTGGRNVGNEMPGPIHNVAKRLAPTLSRPGIAGAAGGTQWGQRLHLGRRMKDDARQILETKMKPWHTSSIYMGMIRKAKETSSGKLQTTGYTTFRRISRHSRDAANHWIHPGIKPRKFAKKVQTHVEKIAESIVLAAMKGSR